MKCQDVQQALDAQLVGTLGRADAETLDAHLATCPECRAMVADARRLQAELRLIGVEGPLPRVWERVSARLEASARSRCIAAIATMASSVASAAATASEAPANALCDDVTVTISTASTPSTISAARAVATTTDPRRSLSRVETRVNQSLMAPGPIPGSRVCEPFESPRRPTTGW